jgi:acyl-CoA synthetase (AMP-forming)/AMP-acid ligase II
MIFPNDIFDLASVVRAVAREHPERIAVVEPSGRGSDGKRRYARHSYRQLSSDAESVAVGLREMGIAERTRTVFMAPPSYEACVTYVALTRVGATVVMIDPTVGLRNVGERLRRIHPEAFVGIPITHLARMAFGWGPRLIDKAIVVGENAFFPRARTLASLRRPAPAEPKRADVGPDDPMTVLYTTGSTGPAKPALYTHRNFCGVLRIVEESWSVDPSKGTAVDMAVFPAFFIVGLSMGGTVVVPPIDFVRETPATTDSAALLEVIHDCGVRSLFGSPVLLENLARHAVAHGITAPSLERVIGGGAPITGSAMQALTKMMPNGEVFANYGATEALPSTAHGAKETLGETWAKTVAGRGICVGRPFSGVELRIAKIQDGVADDFEALPRGEIGEILVQSPHVSARYFDDPESTRKNKIGAWHRIGDAGYLDEERRLWVVGRVSQRVRGEKGPLFSLLCEPIFDAHPQVRRSGLVGVPSGASEKPVMCVEAQPGADRVSLREELLALAREHAVTKDIAEVLFIDRLPVDPRHNSKIERPKLAKWAENAMRAGPERREGLFSLVTAASIPHPSELVALLRARR